VATNPVPIPIQLYEFTANTPAVAAYVNAEIDQLYTALQGGLGSAHLATNAGILPSQLIANGVIVPRAGGVMPGGLITMQVQTVTITALANTSTAGASTWPVAFTTFITAWAEIQSNGTNNGTVMNSTQGSNTTQGNAIVYNVTGSNNAVTIHIYGLGIL
jgi:hypothetical protein